MTDVTPNSPEVQVKTCTKCGVCKPVNEFQKHKRHSDGLASQCKACCSEQKRNNYPAIREKSREKSRKYYAEHREQNAINCREYRAANRESIAKQKHEYYLANRERDAARKREYYIANREREIERVRKWKIDNRERRARWAREYYLANLDRVVIWRQRFKDNNPEFRRVYQHRRRARIAAAGGTYNSADIRRQKSMQTDRKGVLRCWWCSCQINEYHVDHRIPLAKGGTNDARNICLACPDCNLRKNSKMPADFNGRLL